MGIAATLALMALVWSHSMGWIVLALLGIMAALEIWHLIHFVEHTNRELARFLEAIRYADFSQSFSAVEKGPSFEALSAAFSEIQKHFHKIRQEKEEHTRYIETVVQHIGIGLLVYRLNGEVTIANHALRRLLALPVVKHLEDLSAFSSELTATLWTIQAGEKKLLPIEDASRRYQLALNATGFKLQGETYTLVSIQNLHQELEEKEMEAWQKLIRVLTHEIMNSITPIASLAETANTLLGQATEKQKNQCLLKGDPLEDIQEALHTIERRSKGLLNFVDNYRKLTRVPAPQFQVVMVERILEGVVKLMQHQLAQKGIRPAVVIEPSTLEVTTDPQMIEQVLINLLLNSLQALDGKAAPRLELRAGMASQGGIWIEVRDNGVGIIPEALEKIFVPFFTTRREGSGIGLSLCREIMRRHHGNISVHSIPELETTFTLNFP